MFKTPRQRRAPSTSGVRGEAEVALTRADVRALTSGAGGTAAVDGPASERQLLAKGLSISEGCRLMHLARSTYYDPPTGQPIVEARLAARITEICAEWPRYGSLAVNRTSCWRCS